ncbi:Zinc finger CCCH domain-containing protein 55 [Linum grandiflorum]
MGYILIHDLGDRDLARLALGHETLLLGVISKAKAQLGLSSNTLPSSPHFHNPISRPVGGGCGGGCCSPFPHSPSQGNGCLADFARNPSPHSWPVSSSSSFSPRSSAHFLSCDGARSAGSYNEAAFAKSVGSNGGGGDCSSSSNGADALEDYPFDEYLSFLDDSSSSCRNEELDVTADASFHRRRFSESDACGDTEDVGFGNGYRPSSHFHDGKFDCLFFVVAGFNGRVMVGSPREMESLYLQQREGMMRLKAAHQQQQQRLAYNKYMNLLLQQQNDPQRFIGGCCRLGAEEFHKFGRFCPERNEIFAMSMSEKANSVARQIYLTFPADSTFKDEDVSNYFSTFGPVEDVRIPYQQKRMFGFVTFLHAETVKLILARGNPHFICDSRVLVKPYKEKGKAANEQQHHLHHQVMDRGNFSSCSSPSGVDVRELYDLPVGPRMTYNSQELMLRRKLEEQAELQVAIELQGRRLVNLQLPNMRGDYVHHHQRSLSIGAPVSMSAQSPLNQNIAFESEPITEAFENSADDAAKQNSLTDVKMPCNIVVDKEEDTNPDSTNMNNCHDEDLDRPRASTEMKGSSSLEEDDEHMPITSL